MNKVQLSVWMMVALSIMFACATGSTVKRTPGKGSAVDNMGAMREDFNPVDLDDDDIDIKDTAASGTNIDNLLDRSKAAPADTIGNGYRIQIIQTTDPEEAREVQKDGIVRFEHAVYRVFDPPFYKVRIGDFVNWLDAEKVQKLAIQKGFRAAWVIRTKINLKKAYHAADEW